MLCCCAIHREKLLAFKFLFGELGHLKQTKKMKKRTCRHYCSPCKLNFESWARYEVHVSSRRHSVNELQISSNNSLDTEILHDIIDENVIPADDNCDSLEQDYPQRNFEESYFVPEDTCSDTETTDLDEREDTPLPSPINESQSSSNINDDAGEYFPFPSELFFLLYCYVHNISRPKVSRKPVLFLRIARY